MRAARIVGDDAVAIIIEPEEFSALMGEISRAPGSPPMFALYNKLCLLDEGRQDQLLYEAERDLLASEPTPAPVVEDWT